MRKRYKAPGSKAVKLDNCCTVVSISDIQLTGGLASDLIFCYYY